MRRSSPAGRSRTWCSRSRRSSLPRRVRGSASDMIVANARAAVMGSLPSRAAAAAGVPRATASRSRPSPGARDLTAGGSRLARDVGVLGLPRTRPNSRQRKRAVTRLRAAVGWMRRDNRDGRSQARRTDERASTDASAATTGLSLRTAHGRAMVGWRVPLPSDRIPAVRCALPTSDSRSTSSPATWTSTASSAPPATASCRAAGRSSAARRSPSWISPTPAASGQSAWTTSMA